MSTTAIHGESLIKEINCNNIPLELVSVPATIWCGAAAYAPNGNEEPDIKRRAGD